MVEEIQRAAYHGVQIHEAHPRSLFGTQLILANSLIISCAFFCADSLLSIHLNGTTIPSIPTACLEESHRVEQIRFVPPALPVRHL